MSQHPSDDLLRAFVEGDVDEDKAVEIAEHLDCCASCCTLAAELDGYREYRKKVRYRLIPFIW